MDTRMQIVITQGSGAAGTGLAAFDAALHDAGVSNLNLLTLSSVIPPGASVRCGGLRRGLADGSEGSQAQWGDRLYCVLAESRVAEPGGEAWAGLAWWQTDDDRGIFVEHHGHCEEQVTSDLQLSIRDCVERRGLCFESGRPGMVVNGVQCVDQPVCALVVATYETHGWGSSGTGNPA